MINKVKIKYFKQFKDQKFDLSDQIILAGPNNCGKTTLLQAITAWNLALQKWNAERPKKSKAKQRTGVPITRKDFTAVPLREMNLLWTDRSVSYSKMDAAEGKVGHPRKMEITVEGVSGENSWNLTFEFRYQSREMIYIKPTNNGDIPQEALDLNVVHVPPFSGIGSEETKYDKPYQELLVGQGKAGDILRNLLLEIYQDNNDGWQNLTNLVEEIFCCKLLAPMYEGIPFIVCEYLKGIPEGRGKGGFPQLDIASAGSGFLQVLLLLSFFFARPSSVLLLDEPDAHLHVILQKQIFDRLRSIAAQRNCQLISATHSEVLIGSMDPEKIMSFYETPHRLVGETQQDQVREALKRISTMDMLLAEQSPGVLYVEGESDFNFLRSWARVLDHPMKKWFEASPFWHSNQGRNPAEAKGHLFALKAIKPEMKGVLLLDGDNRKRDDHELRADGLEIIRWQRYEAESYIVNLDLLERFIKSRGVLPIFAHPALTYLREQLPPAVVKDPLESHDYLESSAVSKKLLPYFFQKADLFLRRGDFYQIAEQMKREEIPAEIEEKLDQIKNGLGL